MQPVWRQMFVTLTVCCLPGAPGRAALRPAVDKLARPIVADGRAVGISVGVLDETGGTHFFGYGKLATDGDTAPDADTLFEIGSITKCFTAVLLADMVQKGEVRLEDPAERYVPEGVRLPRVAGRAITLEDLATYSSGLPRMPDNIGDDFAHYPARKMYAFLTGLAQEQGPRSPRRHYLYSNLGFALLGECLAHRAGQKARPLIERRVCRALGMPSTCFEPDEKLKGRVAAVHGQRGRPVAAWENGCIAPSGMLRSSARDMVRFLQANVGAVETPLRPALRLAQEPRYETAAEGPAHRKIGLAWFIDPRTGFHAKNGGTRGSAANVIFDPKRKTAVVVLMNQSRAPAVRLSHQIMQVLAGETDPKVPPGLPTDDGPP